MTHFSFLSFSLLLTHGDYFLHRTPALFSLSFSRQKMVLFVILYIFIYLYIYSFCPFFSSWSIILSSLKPIIRGSNLMQSAMNGFISWPRAGFFLLPHGEKQARVIDSAPKKSRNKPLGSCLTQGLIITEEQHFLSGTEQLNEVR